MGKYHACPYVFSGVHGLLVPYREGSSKTAGMQSRGKKEVWLLRRVLLTMAPKELAQNWGNEASGLGQHSCYTCHDAPLRTK